MLWLLRVVWKPKTNRPGRPRRPGRRPVVRLGVEELQPRVLPSASPFFGAFGPGPAHAFHAGPGASAAIDYGEHCSGNGSTNAASSVFVAVLTDPSGAKATVTFNATTGNLDVRVTGAAANASFSVVVGTTTLGTFTANASGRGHVDASESGLSVAAGTAVSVGSLTGTFISAADAHLAATLSDPSSTSGATGHARYDALEQEFKLSLSGAAANTTYNVLINNVVVKQVTTDGSGKATLKLSGSDLTQAGVTIQVGSTVSVTDTTGTTTILQGTFAAVTHRERC